MSVVWVFLSLFMIGAVVTVGLTSMQYHHRIETSYLWALPQSIADQLTDRMRLRSAERVEVEPLETAEQPP